MFDVHTKGMMNGVNMNCNGGKCRNTRGGSLRVKTPPGADPRIFLGTTAMPGEVTRQTSEAIATMVIEFNIMVLEKNILTQQDTEGGTP